MLLHRRGLGNANSSANMDSGATVDARESGDDFVEHEDCLLDVSDK